MTKSGTPPTRGLDPVVVEALKVVTRFVNHRRRPKVWDKFHRQQRMHDSQSRDCVIAAFEHLRHGGYEFQPFLVRRWALANGWKRVDAQLLDDYAAGVLAGVRYHHADPLGRHAVRQWKADAEGRQAWLDPGRPEHGTPLMRAD